MDAQTKRFSIVGLWVVVLAASLEAETAFKAGFEKGLDADECLGSPKATVSGTATRVTDRFGTSLVLGPGQASCAYEAKGNVSFEQGTLIAWIQPNGWKADLPKAVSIVRGRQGNASIVLWWRPSGKSLIFARREANGKLLAVGKAAYDWTQTSWHHLILAWSAGSVALFVDGRTADHGILARTRCTDAATSTTGASGNWS